MKKRKIAVVSQADARALMSIPKTGTPLDFWREDANHVGVSLMAFGVIALGQRGLVVEISARLHPVVDRTIIDLTLFLHDPIYRQQTRVYQLTLDNPKYKTHSENGMPPIYGSHELIGDYTVELPQCNEMLFQEAVAMFCNRVNLTLDGPIDDPFSLVLK